MTDRKPTDRQIVKGFNLFEYGFNVWMSEYRNTPEDERDFDGHAHMWRAHDAFRRSALAAQERIDARKEGK